MEPNPMNPTPIPPVERPRRPRSVVGPVILILLGLAFLTNNLGIFDFNIWEMMWKLWPVWLIAAGLDMMLGRRTSWGSWVVLGLVVTIIGGAIWAGNLGLAFGGAYGGPAETIVVNADAQGAQRATIQINSGVGELRLYSGAADGKLVEGTVGRLEGERIDQDYTGNSNDVTFILKSRGVSVPGVNTKRNSGVWDLRLAKSVPMDLNLGTGIGKSQIDLTGMTLNRLEVHTGIGEAELTLPATGKFDVKMDNGIGKSTLRIPQGMEARIKANKGIGAVNVSGNFTKVDGYWVTPGFDSATNRVEVQINGGIGEIDIRH